MTSGRSNAAKAVVGSRSSRCGQSWTLLFGPLARKDLIDFPTLPSPMRSLLQAHPHYRRRGFTADGRPAGFQVVNCGPVADRGTAVHGRGKTSQWNAGLSLSAAVENARWAALLRAAGGVCRGDRYRRSAFRVWAQLMDRLGVMGRRGHGWRQPARSEQALNGFSKPHLPQPERHKVPIRSASTKDARSMPPSVCEPALSGSCAHHARIGAIPRPSDFAVTSKGLAMLA